MGENAKRPKTAREKALRQFVIDVWENDHRVMLTTWTPITEKLESQHGTTSFRDYCHLEVQRINGDPSRDAKVYEYEGRCAIFVAPLPGETPNFNSDDE